MLCCGWKSRKMALSPEYIWSQDAHLLLSRSACFFFANVFLMYRFKRLLYLWYCGWQQLYVVAFLLLSGYVCNHMLTTELLYSVVGACVRNWPRWKRSRIFWATKSIACRTTLTLVLRQSHNIQFMTVSDACLLLLCSTDCHSSFISSMHQW